MDAQEDAVAQADTSADIKAVLEASQWRFRFYFHVALDRLTKRKFLRGACVSVNGWVLKTWRSPGTTQEK